MILNVFVGIFTGILLWNTEPSACCSRQRSNARSIDQDQEKKSRGQCQGNCFRGSTRRQARRGDTSNAWLVRELTAFQPVHTHTIVRPPSGIIFPFPAFMHKQAIATTIHHSCSHYFTFVPNLRRRGETSSNRHPSRLAFPVVCRDFAWLGAVVSRHISTPMCPVPYTLAPLAATTP